MVDVEAGGDDLCDAAEWGIVMVLSSTYHGAVMWAIYAREYAVIAGAMIAPSATSAPWTTGATWIL